MIITKELIRKYHLKECSAAEEQAVEAWLNGDEAEVSYPEDFDLDHHQLTGWVNLSERYALGEDEVTPQVSAKRRFRIVRLMIPMAACIGLVVMLGLAYTFLRPVPTQEDFSYQTISAAKGQKRLIALRDGTRIWLNSQSSLTFPAEFSGDKREVTLRGEGYFMVAKNPAKPFIISSPRTITRVLGTHFNLRDYSDENQSVLAVEEGKVSFRGLKSGTELILTADQRGILDILNNRAFAEHVPSEHYGSWRENQLILEDLTLKEIKVILERWYDIHIVIKNTDLGRERYRGSFNNPTIEVVLNSICVATRSNYSQHNKTFIIEK